MATREKITAKTDEEIKKLLVEARAELRTVRFSAAGARAKDTNTPKKLRATIARLLTQLHARKQKATN